MDIHKCQIPSGAPNMGTNLDPLVGTHVGIPMGIPMGISMGIPMGLPMDIHGEMHALHSDDCFCWILLWTRSIHSCAHAHKHMLCSSVTMRCKISVHSK